MSAQGLAVYPAHDCINEAQMGRAQMEKAGFAALPFYRFSNRWSGLLDGATVSLTSQRDPHAVWAQKAARHPLCCTRHTA
jgi:hypothetical protein